MVHIYAYEYIFIILCIERGADLIWSSTFSQSTNIMEIKKCVQNQDYFIASFQTIVLLLSCYIDNLVFNNKINIDAMKLISVQFSIART